ncbi:DUF4350 domain-containing protein [Micromonospora sp. Llam7]|uniref:DUF4350 domain-containing protein n=1 Tax=Micromonospora tarapacensis TaxID=2835305 RepID=UPI001C8408F3|nr:DUF4350 domain-containing protein [Micromonospora tarapacensis]MBX7268998.1 DUF4350 domain-containing protein [Micromonospora tarapacensis]
MIARRPRRRHRVVVPLLLGALLLGVTLVTREIDQPDQTGAGFLSPVATGDDGGSRLAASLARRGIEVRRETDTVRALLATRPGPSTLFIPAPALLHPRSVNYLGLLPAGTRLVLVDPPRRVLVAAGLPLRPAGRRWAARAVAPHAVDRPCPLAELAPAATAAVTRQRYAATGPAGHVDLCYSAGLARVPGPAESVVVGASDPFRNGRIDEWHNQTFATGLLATSGRVVWLDLDGPAPPPPEPSSAPTSQLTEPTGDGYDEPADRDELGGDGRPMPMASRPAGDASGSGGPDGNSPNPLWSAFPPWFWAVLLQLTLAALLIAVGRARRLGPPAPEPLPVTVPAAETVLGRARLYQRAGARESVAQALRAAARSRLARRLHLPADTPDGGVAAAVAAGTGDRPDAIHELLYGDTPGTDRDLIELAAGLDRATRGGVATPTDAARQPPQPATPPQVTRPATDPPYPARLPRPRSEGDTE